MFKAAFLYMILIGISVLYIANSLTTYTVQSSLNEIDFVINREHFKATESCFGIDAGDKVIFVKGKPNLCGQATFFDLSTQRKCDVMCPDKGKSA